MKKKDQRIRIFVAYQICVCSAAGPDCCAAPGQSEKEIFELAEAIEENLHNKVETNEIRDVKVLDRFPQVARLFKKHGYNALPIITVGRQIVAYGIPDKEFIINCIGEAKK